MCSVTWPHGFIISTSVRFVRYNFLFPGFGTDKIYSIIFILHLHVVSLSDFCSLQSPVGAVHFLSNSCSIIQYDIRRCILHFHWTQSVFKENALSLETLFTATTVTMVTIYISYVFITKYVIVLFKHWLSHLSLTAFFFPRPCCSQHIF